MTRDEKKKSSAESSVLGVWILGQGQGPAGVGFTSQHFALPLNGCSPSHGPVEACPKRAPAEAVTRLSQLSAVRSAHTRCRRAILRDADGPRDPVAASRGFVLDRHPARWRSSVSGLSFDAPRVAPTRPHAHTPTRPDVPVSHCLTAFSGTGPLEMCAGPIVCRD